MAILTAEQLAEIRRSVADRNGVITYTKPPVNRAIQAIEDWFELNRPSLSAAINAATTPLVLTAAQKKNILIFYLQQKFGRENT